MENIKFKLIEYIVSEASESEVEGLYEFLINNDYKWGLELLDRTRMGEIKKELREE